MTVSVLLSSMLALAVSAERVPGALLDGLSWRLVGPFRGGWATVAAGIPGELDTYYVGTAGGGVWKTIDGGVTWTPSFDGPTASSIGALAIAPSDPRVIYAGSGQPEPRWDVAAGDGVYRSLDGGKTWERAGLQATRHIGAILVDPRDAKTLLAAAVGHFFGPNPERGVFRSTDGGKSWTHTLAIDAETGAVDLAADPGDPKVIFAAAWQARAWPWLSYFTPMIGPKSGLYKSTDGGIHWTRITASTWPTGQLGRIGLATARTAKGLRVYAVVDAREQGGIYRSDDGGTSWQRVHERHGLGSIWYFARLTVAPGDPDTLYVMGQSIRRSTDGGKTLAVFKGAPGGDDYHALWIDPQHPERMITAADQGAVVSADGGKSWSSWYNQPTGQFYHLAADDRFPYWIYSGQQDSGTAAIASRSDYGSISFRDWHPAGGDERDYVLPDPADPKIVYGSGLGGRLSRWDERTGEVQNISPWPVSSYGRRPNEWKFHYTWITPIAARKNALYLGAQVLFMSEDQGAHWKQISPELSAGTADRKRCSGDQSLEGARACGYGVIYSIALSPRDEGEIWIGTDDGLIHLTRDGGKTWRNVTPPAIPPWAKLASLDVSALESGVAYAAVDNHRQDDFRPHLFRTRDYGASWTELTAGLPRESFADVLRADPIQKGLLYAGTDTGVYVSFDDGALWQPLQRNLPHAWVRDLLVHGDDLIAATQGRAIWVLDDLTPLRELARALPKAPAHLFAPASAIRVRKNANRDTPLPPEEPAGKNPPAGAIFDYWLAADARQVALEIRDAKSDAMVRRFASDEKPPQPRAERYFAELWTHAPAVLSAKKGAHRFVWDLRGPRPRSASADYSIAAIPNEDTPTVPQGALVEPGEYRVTLRVDGRNLNAPLRVLPDPRSTASAGSIRDALALHREVAALLERDFIVLAELRAVEKQLQAHDQALGREFATQTQPLTSGEGEASLNLSTLAEILAGIATDLEDSDRAPTDPQRDVVRACSLRLSEAEQRWRAVKQAHAKTIQIPPADRLTLDGDAAGEDLP